MVDTLRGHRRRAGDDRRLLAPGVASSSPNSACDDGDRVPVVACTLSMDILPSIEHEVRPDGAWLGVARTRRPRPGARLQFRCGGSAAFALRTRPRAWSASVVCGRGLVVRRTDTRQRVRVRRHGRGRRGRAVRADQGEGRAVERGGDTRTRSSSRTSVIPKLARWPGFREGTLAAGVHAAFGLPAAWIRARLHRGVETSSRSAPGALTDDQFHDAVAVRRTSRASAVVGSQSVAGPGSPRLAVKAGPLPPGGRAPGDRAWCRRRSRSPFPVR